MSHIPVKLKALDVYYELSHINNCYILKKERDFHKRLTTCNLDCSISVSNVSRSLFESMSCYSKETRNIRENIR